MGCYIKARKLLTGKNKSLIEKSENIGSILCLGLDLVQYVD